MTSEDFVFDFDERQAERVRAAHKIAEQKRQEEQRRNLAAESLGLAMVRRFGNDGLHRDGNVITVQRGSRKLVVEALGSNSFSVQTETDDVERQEPERVSKRSMLDKVDGFFGR